MGANQEGSESRDRPEGEPGRARIYLAPGGCAGVADYLRTFVAVGANSPSTYGSGFPQARRHEPDRAEPQLFI